MADLPDRPVPADPRQLRASDADRERVAEVLRRAAGEGRLALDELEERLGVVYAARTYAELEPVTADLPSHAAPPPIPSAPPVQRRTGSSTKGGAVAILGGFQRKGAWDAPGVFTCFAVMGGGDIDLREARLVDGEITIWAFALMGGINIIVPEEAEVRVNGIGIMGGFDHRASGAGQANGPRITINGLAFWGGVDVRRLPSEEERQRRKLERKRLKREGQIEG
ncbi:DUF1707 SHOCT-like domain-containing protein [Rugosimonospora africana]|uniref:Cell wall-active antibiotics response LiaF-like C-terminal domain-containing protein n=1 Tax=Rugosimonospora africana TaxID=556532 RepID=A0A8J3QTU4_9ACTN|nr:DUF1707 domain-containing protein [Rugosimonospora africana]GIH16424.1 hypothetical protein Raf01_45960 [Rugosimonospora africana]